MAKDQDRFNRALAQARGDGFVEDKNFSRIEMVGYPRRLADLKRGDMIVGYLFEHGLTTFVEGQLAGSMPISGPIFWVELVNEYHKYSAQCGGCGAQSKAFVERDSKILHWAYNHRCKERVELKYVIR